MRVSDCSGRNTKHVPWSVIERIAAATKEPNGFVFHESRVGSTLVADMLASDASNMVFSESKPPPLIASHCNGCSEEKKVALLRTTIRAMGNSARHKRLFFKFQSSNSPNIRLFLKAFPNTPWIYLYRVRNLYDDSYAGMALTDDGNPILKALDFLSFGAPPFLFFTFFYFIFSKTKKKMLHFVALSVFLTHFFFALCETAKLPMGCMHLLLVKPETGPCRSACLAVQARWVSAMLARQQSTSN